MKLIIQNEKNNIKIRIPDFMIFNRLSINYISNQIDTALDTTYLMILAKVLKRSKDVLNGEPLLEVISEDTYICIDL